MVFDHVMSQIELEEPEVASKPVVFTKTSTLQDYLGRFRLDLRQIKAQEAMAEHADLLSEVADVYGVPERFIVSIWGVETAFGHYMGSYNIVEQLMKKAYKGRRKNYFRQELISALKILQEGDMTLADMYGSFDGGMGQPQFMPSSYIRFAVDGNEDGVYDIYDTEADVFSSIAHYLSEHGWNPDLTWATKVTLPDHFDRSLDRARKSLNEWKEYGVEPVLGQSWPNGDPEARLLVYSDNSNQETAYLAYANFDVIFRYNHSNYYVIAIGELADSLMEPDI